MDEVYNKYINFIGLDVVEIPKIFRTKEEPTKGEYIRRIDGYYYTWKEPGLLQKKGEYEPVEPHPMILKDIIAHIFKDLLEKQGYKIDIDKLTNYYVRKDDDTIPHENEDIFSIVKGFEYRIRAQGNLIYLVLEYKIRIEPKGTIKDLIEKGISANFFLNSFVLFEENGRQRKGKIEKIDSDDAEIRDLKGNICKIDLKSIYPETKTHILDEILIKLGRRKNAVFLQRRATFLDIKQGSRKRLDEIRRIKEDISKIFPINCGDFKINIKDSLTPILDVQSDGFQGEIIDTKGTMETDDYLFYGDSIEKEPNLLFDEEDPSKSHSQPYYGLKFFGPYSKRDFSMINVSIICPRDKNDDMQKLLQLIKEGSQRVYDGTKKMFRIDLSLNQTKLLDDVTVEGYEKACEDFIQEDKGKTDVVLVYVPETPKYWPYSPYYRAKYKLLTEGYTSQMITENTFDNITFSLLNLASAIYAKAGGVPWVLEREIRDVDVIVGVAFSQIIPERAQGLNMPSERYLGFVNIFDQYGKWLFFQANTTPFSKEVRTQAFENIISEVIKKFETERGFKPSRIAFHYSKGFGKDEKEAIIKAVEKEVKNPKIIFINIDDDHPFRAFDLSTTDGSLPRRSYVYLGENEYLLSTTGISDISRQGIGTPRLLHIKTYEYPEKFLDSKQVMEQVFSLTRLNWATAMTLVREPVTISFSKMTAYMIASLTSAMWSQITIPSLLKRLEGKTWFI